MRYLLPMCGVVALCACVGPRVALAPVRVVVEGPSVASPALRYDDLLAQFSNSPLWPMARYNRGLLREARGALGAAVEDYVAITRHATPAAAENTWLDAQIRLGVCQSRLGNTWPAVAAFDAVLALPELTDDDRLEALSGRAIAMHAGGADDAAEVALSDVLSYVDRMRRDVARYDDRGMAAEAAFRLAELSRRRFAAAPMRTEADLAPRCELLLVAQNRYVRAMRYGDHHTVAVAGLHIGEMYEALHDELLAMPAPADMTPADALQYQADVHEKISVLVRKAVVMYERALLAGRKDATSQTWVTRLENALDRLRALVVADGGASLQQRGLTPGPRTVQ